MKNSTRKALLGLVVVLMLGVFVTQNALDPKIREIHAGEKTQFQGLSNEFILGPLLGMQQAVAGMLWVRADEFFHEGDYDAILPIVRMVTWLDPHQLDVYITGAWHLSYNFTDSSERSDRRYIPAAVRLLQEGDANNPEVYDVAFELGRQYWDKIKNFEQAEKWFRTATQRKAAGSDGQATEPAPNFVWHQLAHAMENEGKIDEAIALWKQILDRTEAQVKADSKNFSLVSVRDSERHNLMMNLKRKFSRYEHRIDWNIDARVTRSYDMTTGEPSPRDAYLSIDEKKDGAPVGQPRPPAVTPPWNTAFETVRNGSTQVTFIRDKVMDVKGVFNVGDGARVNVRLHDDDWKEKQVQSFTFDVDQSQTIMQDQLSVRGKQWGRKIDMSRDPKMYSFSRPYYYLVLEYNPRATSPFLQDRFGWSGEGLTDEPDGDNKRRSYLWVEKRHPADQKDIRMIRKVYKLSKEQVRGTKPVTEADVVSNEEYDQAIQQAAQKDASAKSEK